MDREGSAIRRLDRLLWGAIALTAAMVLAAPLVSKFRVAWPTFAAPALTCALLLAAGTFYRTWRVDARLASGLTCTAQVIAFAAVGAPLSYIAASANLPLRDDALAAIDQALGFDWRALLSFMNAFPELYAVLRPIYLSLTLQMTTVVLCLAFCGHLLWLRVYNLAFCFAALISIAVSVVLPAAGAWTHYGLSPSDSTIFPAVSTSWPVFEGLRDASLRTLIAVGSEGIITFPSLHAALAVIVIAALWPVHALRWLAVAVNSAMLIATPIDGSHYLVDVLAGIGVAILSLAAAHALASAATWMPVPLPGGAKLTATAGRGN
jgi:hypothetical protein